ncbi:MAG: hypothetical protein ACE10K_07755 [Rhodothermales bacterium]
MEKAGGAAVVLKNTLAFQNPAAKLETGRRVPIGAGQAQALGSLTISTRRKGDSKHDEQEFSSKGRWEPGCDLGHGACQRRRKKAGERCSPAFFARRSAADPQTVSLT